MSKKNNFVGKMKKEDRLVGVTPFNPYARCFTGLIKDFGLEVCEHIPVTDKTIALGVKHSPEMICFPYKILVGNYIELLEKGANTMIMYSSTGICKQRHYYKMLDSTLHNLGYEFETIKLTPYDFIPIPLPKFMNQLTYLSGYNKLKISRILFNLWKLIGEIEKPRIDQPWGDINIALIGEIYCVIDDDINHNIRPLLKNMGAVVHSTLSIREYLKDGIIKSKKRKALRKLCWEFLDENGDPGGHGLHSVEDVYLWTEKGIDGIIHITPLTCHPEIVVEDTIDYICKRNKIPLLRVKIDETISPLNVTTRVETFFELIKRKKRLCGEGMKG